MTIYKKKKIIEPKNDICARFRSSTLNVTRRSQKSPEFIMPVPIILRRMPFSVSNTHLRQLIVRAVYSGHRQMGGRMDIAALLFC